VAPDVTANVVLTVLLAAKENLAVIAHLVTALPAIVRHVMVKDVRRATGKDDHQAKAEARVKVVKGDLRADLKAVRWAHRILNASWKMRCGLMLIRMESSAKKN
jgi:hypothetical protein